MKGTEGIIDKILSDARANANKINEVAEYERAMAEKSTLDWIDDYLQKQRKLLECECEEVVERKLTLAKLDKRKLILKAKQEIVDAIFNRALKILQSLKRDEYLNLVLRLLKDYAQEGDQIITSADGVVDKDDLAKSKVVIDKKLTISKEKGKFIGGVMLIGASCDKDLTFKAILEENREEIVSKITSELF